MPRAKTAQKAALLDSPEDVEVVCIHPGGPRLVGAAAVRAAFEAVFSSGGIDVRPDNVRIVNAMGSAVHSVVEKVQIQTAEGPRTGYVMATNVFVKTALGWRMVLHHASPGTPNEPPELIETPSVLH
jgi:ketosteroid isomerase-like protein